MASFVVGCALGVNPSDHAQRLYLGQGMDDFTSALEEFTNSHEIRGVLPESLGQRIGFSNLQGEFIYRNLTFSHEFFLFDKKKIIILLNIWPLYFIVINNEQFYTHFIEEFEQIKNGLWGKRKSIRHSPFFKQVGSHKVEIYFTPQEVNFSTRKGNSQYRIRQTGSLRPRPDIWRLIEAAQKLEVSMPKFEDVQFHQDLIEQIAAKKRRRIYTKAFALVGVDEVPHYGKIKDVLPFPYIIGTDLKITENLLDGENLIFQNQKQLSQDFLVLSSLHWGNPVSSPTLNHSGGVVILIRGPVQQWRNWLLGQARQVAKTNVPSPPKPKIIISEVGNNVGASGGDYVVLHNANDFHVSLAGLFIGRDSGCNLHNSWSEFRQLPGRLLAPRGYFLIVSATSKNLPLLALADWTWNGTINDNYCILISSSFIPPKETTNILENLEHLDFVHFNNLAKKKAYQREDPCTNQNESQSFDDNWQLIAPVSLPRNSASPACPSKSGKSLSTLAL